MQLITIQCTKKLAAELNVPLSEVPASAVQSLYGWHAHLFLFKRRKCVLVMNNESRYNFVIYGLVKADFKRFNELVLEHIQLNLLKDGMSQKQIDIYLDEHKEFYYSPTSDRSIISQINEMIMVVGHVFEQNLYKYNELRVDNVNRFLNRYIFMKLPKLYSGETMQEALRDLVVET
jgi:hypothetical protein